MLRNWEQSQEHERRLVVIAQQTKAEQTKAAQAAAYLKSYVDGFRSLLRGGPTETEVNNRLHEEMGRRFMLPEGLMLGGKCFCKTPEGFKSQSGFAVLNNGSWELVKADGLSEQEQHILNVWDCVGYKAAMSAVGHFNLHADNDDGDHRQQKLLRFVKAEHEAQEGIPVLDRRGQKGCPPRLVLRDLDDNQLDKFSSIVCDSKRDLFIRESRQAGLPRGSIRGRLEPDAILRTF